MLTTPIRKSISSHKFISTCIYNGRQLPPARRSPSCWYQESQASRCHEVRSVSFSGLQCDADRWIYSEKESADGQETDSAAM